MAKYSFYRPGAKYKFNGKEYTANIPQQLFSMVDEGYTQGLDIQDLDAELIDAGSWSPEDKEQLKKGFQELWSDKGINVNGRPSVVYNVLKMLTSEYKEKVIT